MLPKSSIREYTRGWAHRPGDIIVIANRLCDDERVSGGAQLRYPAARRAHDWLRVEVDELLYWT